MLDIGALIVSSSIQFLVFCLYFFAIELIIWELFLAHCVMFLI